MAVSLMNKHLSSSNSSVPAGVVTGADYRTLLEACRAGGYALPAVNVTSSSMVNAVLEAASQSHSDVIIQVSHSGARFYGGNGLENTHNAAVFGALSMAHHVHLLAQSYGVAVVLHTDHANRPLIPWLDDLITHSARHHERTGRPLFSSHMLDLSAEPLDANIDTCADMLKRLAPLDIGLEIELGITGGEEDGIGHEFDEDSTENSHLYTQPEDVLKAWQRLNPLGMLSIAASFGNVHGVYKPGNVKLHPEILKDSQELVQKTAKTDHNPLHLVFHGGSGSEIDKIRQAISYGVFKMNLDTDTQFAYAHKVAAFIMEHQEAFEHQICPKTGKPFKKIYDPRAWLRKGELGVAERVKESFEILGSHGKSIAR
ncbi:class II fructose-bisphosphate aldolase [Acetobacteraceae bacterium ESL0709]|nr:class II fructose-bisphosphate aldolase [Acetobacteraceae bacterium ESL0697]MDF7678479.1 class II fructose-bisphosphate aldolase [Acetobacteraceae bacterium ESL0709]